MPEPTDLKSKLKRPRGRPWPEGPRAVRVNITLPPDLREKLEALGGSKWIQEQIKQAHV